MAYNVNMSTQRYIGTFEHLVLLAILHAGAKAYAPNVRATIEDLTGRPVNRGSLYVTIDRLERKGLVASRLERGDSAREGRPLRRLKITSEGVDAIRSVREVFLSAWEDLGEVLEGRT